MYMYMYVKPLVHVHVTNYIVIILLYILFTLHVWPSIIVCESFFQVSLW